MLPPRVREAIHLIASIATILLALSTGVGWVASRPSVAMVLLWGFIIVVASLVLIRVAWSIGSRVHLYVSLRKVRRIFRHDRERLRDAELELTGMFQANS